MKELVFLETFELCSLKESYMKEFVFLASLELCSPKESCMKEFVFLEMFEMCIPKEQRSSMALPVLSRKAVVQKMSGLPGHCLY